MMMAGAMHPPFSLFGCAEKRKRAVHGPKEKSRWWQTGPEVQFANVRGLSPPGQGRDLVAPAGARRTGALVGVFPRVRRLPAEAVGEVPDTLFFSFRCR